MDYSFEKRVKSMLGWSLSQWKQGGEKLLAMKRLINSLKFWSGKLHSAKRKNNVILTLYHESSKAYPSLQKIVDILENLNRNIIVTGYAKFKNRRYLSLSFENLETRDFVVRNLTTVDNMEIAYLHWVDEAYLDIITIDWLSNETDFLLISEYIEQFMDIESATRINTNLTNGIRCVSGRVVFTGRLKDGVNKDNIPHLGCVDGLECLILVEGRSYQCLTCGKNGHKAVMCYKAYCKYCKGIVNKTHFCQAELNSVALMEERNVVVTKTEENNLEIYAEKSDGKNGRETKMEKKTNIFENKKLLFPTHSSLKSTLQEDKCNHVNDESLLKGLPMFHAGTDQWYSEFQNNNKMKTNDYITEDSKIGDPDFMLIDTPTDESDSESDSICVMRHEFQSYPNLPRSFIEQSTMLLKDSAEILNTGNSEKIQKDFSIHAEPLSTDKLGLQNKIETISKQIEENKLLLVETGCRKKEITVKGKKKKSKRK